MFSDQTELSTERIVLSITYNSTLEANRRCHLRSWNLKRRSWTFLVFADIAPSLALAVRLHSTNSYIGIASFPVLVLLIHMLWDALYQTALRQVLHSRFPLPDSSRICTSSLGLEGFRDVTPDRTSLIPWNEIAEVSMDHDDIYLRSKNGEGHFIPSSAFYDKNAGQLFYRTVLVLWHSKGTVWPTLGDNATQETLLDG